MPRPSAGPAIASWSSTRTRVGAARPRRTARVPAPPRRGHPRPRRPGPGPGAEPPARSSKDWYHLLEVCGVFGTLLADQDGIYDANDPNDRLVLGLRGTMSEVELFTMRSRLERGRLNKAERGELFLAVPCGYLSSPPGRWPSTPTSRRARPCGWSSTSSTNWGPPRRCSGTWETTTSARAYRPHHGTGLCPLEWRVPLPRVGPPDPAAPHLRGRLWRMASGRRPGARPEESRRRPPHAVGDRVLGGDDQGPTAGVRHMGSPPWRMWPASSRTGRDGGRWEHPARGRRCSAACWCAGTAAAA